MRILRTVSIAVLLSVGIPFAALAGEFDGSKPSLCSVSSVTEFTLEVGSRAVTPESEALPQFLTVDFAKKVVKPARENEMTHGRLCQSGAI